MEDFEKITPIGKGTFGLVYLVRHLKSNRLYALKKVRLDERSKNRTKEAVLREVRISSKLKHPNIVTFHLSFFDEHEDHLCIVQDYCDGGTLEDKIREQEQKKAHFPEKQVMQWFIQISMAVTYMHSHKILHRDLKSQNVFLMKKALTCKLGDFGISKAMEQTLDLAQTCVGTPCYLAPEMCQDIPYSSKADVWALGCLLYEMCALQPAFDANNLISLIYKIVKGDYEPIPSTYSTSLSEVVKTILVKSPEDRPSARQVLNLPYVQHMLSEFVEEKQDLLDQRNMASPSRNYTAAHTAMGNGDTHLPSDRQISTEPSSPEEVSDSAPVSTQSPLDVQHRNTRVTHPETDAELQQSKQLSIPDRPDSGKPIYCAICGKQFRMKSWLNKHTILKHQGEKPGESTSALDPPHEPLTGPEGNHDQYEDDFEADDDAEEVIEEDIIANDSDDDIPEEEGLSSSSEEEEERRDFQYADDFEECASDGELDEIVNLARDICEKPNSEKEETVKDDRGPVTDLKNLLQEHCKAALGEDRFTLLTRKQDNTSISPPQTPRSRQAHRPSSSFLHRSTNAEHLETCYLVEELFSQTKMATQ